MVGMAVEGGWVLLGWAVGCWSFSPGLVQRSWAGCAPGCAGWVGCLTAWHIYGSFIGTSLRASLGKSVVVLLRGFTTIVMGGGLMNSGFS